MTVDEKIGDLEKNIRQIDNAMVQAQRLLGYVSRLKMRNNLDQLRESMAKAVKARERMAAELEQLKEGKG